MNMLQVLMACFLSFSVIGGQCADIAIATRAANYNIGYVSYDAIEVEKTTVNLVVGRHRMVQIKSVSARGLDCIDVITEYYNGSALENFHFTDEVTTINTTTVATTTQVSSRISTGLQVVAGINGAKVSGDKKVEGNLMVSNTITYSATESNTFTIEFDVKPEIINGKVFALGMVADIYEITYETWQWDDYWWGDYVVSGSRKTGTGYIVANPYVSVVFRDGTFVS